MDFFCPVGVLTNGNFLNWMGIFYDAGAFFFWKFDQNDTNLLLWHHISLIFACIARHIYVPNSSRPRKIWCRSMTPFQSTGFFSRWGFRPTGDSWNEREISRVQREIKATGILDVCSLWVEDDSGEAGTRGHQPLHQGEGDDEGTGWGPGGLRT